MKNRWHDQGDHFAVELWDPQCYKQTFAELNQLQALVDADGLRKMMDHPGTWGAHPSKTTDTCYVTSTIKGTESRRKTIWLHRIVTDCPDGLEPDHLNHNGLDNRPLNLQIGTHVDNSANRRPPRKMPCTHCGNVPTKATYGQKTPRAPKMPMCIKCKGNLDIPGFVYCKACMVDACFATYPTSEPKKRKVLRSRDFLIMTPKIDARPLPKVKKLPAPKSVAERKVSEMPMQKFQFPPGLTIRERVKLRVWGQSAR